jgi:hypothetical protein
VRNRAALVLLDVGKDAWVAEHISGVVSGGVGSLAAAYRTLCRISRHRQAALCSSRFVRRRRDRQCLCRFHEHAARRSPGADVAGGEPVHGADAAGGSPVPVQTWSGCHTSARKEADVPQCAMAQGGAARATDLCRQLAFNGVPAPGSARLGRYDRAPKNSTHADWHTPLRGATDCAPSTNEPASEDERTDGGPHRMRHITAALLHRSAGNRLCRLRCATEPTWCSGRRMVGRLTAAN